jgi:hypothetical protein
MTNFIVIHRTLLVVAGLAYAASRMGVSSVWILAGALVIIGIGLRRHRQDAAEAIRLSDRLERTAAPPLSGTSI